MLSLLQLGPGPVDVADEQPLSRGVGLLVVRPHLVLDRKQLHLEVTLLNEPATATLTCLVMMIITRQVTLLHNPPKCLVMVIIMVTVHCSKRPAKQNRVMNYNQETGTGEGLHQKVESARI